jgi:hypothetical protein
MEPFLISKVEAIIRISSRGFFVLPVFPQGGPTNRFFVGDQIELRRQDGSSLESKLAGIEHFRGLDGHSSWGLRLPPEVKESGTPVGAEIWWIAEGRK